jgi:2-amino-4-hydroxy-6-hydroxymethyldihydropteridine diphosphokinase
MKRTEASVVIYLGLGANLGDRQHTLRSAVAALEAAGLEIVRVSSSIETDYLGPGSPQPRYLNAAVEARTTLPPLALLDVTQHIEAAHGRQPDSHMQPRPLDIDILLYGGWTIRHPRLVVPHPRLHERRFALEPLRELGALDARPNLARALAQLDAAGQAGGGAKHAAVHA